MHDCCPSVIAHSAITQYCHFWSFFKDCFKSNHRYRGLVRFLGRFRTTFCASFRWCWPLDSHDVTPGDVDSRCRSTPGTGHTSLCNICDKSPWLYCSCSLFAQHSCDDVLSLHLNIYVHYYFCLKFIRWNNHNYRWRKFTSVILACNDSLVFVGEPSASAMLIVGARKKLLTMWSSTTNDAVRNT